MKLLVDAPDDSQQLLEVFEGGSYFDLSRVLWDERIDGPMPEIVLGGMVREDDGLSFSEDRKAIHDAALVPPVPQVISFRQAKTFMELCPVGNSTLWAVALAAVEAIADPVQKIKMRNLLLDSTVYERARADLVSFAASLGINGAALDQMFRSADTL